jgi:outer membrane immunogenic protein
MVLIFSGAASAQAVWQGVYAGGNIGGALARSTANTSTVFRLTGYFDAASLPAIDTAGRQKLNAHDFTGGLEAGANGQIGNVVFGAETDYESLRLSSSQNSSLPYTCCTTTSFAVNQSYKTRWLFTARPRVGYAIGQALVFATGGVAVTKVNYQEVFTDTFANANESGAVDKTRTGWAGGFGAAYQLPKGHWSVKGEYLYTDFGRTTMTSNNLIAYTPPLAFPSSAFTHSMALHGHVIRVGFDYRWSK